MRIARVEATAHRMPLKVPFLRHEVTHSFLIARVETDNGFVGWGIAGTHPLSTAEMINREMGPFLVGKDPLDAEAIWDQLWWTFNQRAWTGTVMYAISALDIALWDIRGKFLNQPVWRLLGGFQRRVPAYITFGLLEYSREELVEAARYWVGQGADKLKMVVAINGAKDVAEDAARVRAVREAVGDRVQLMIDANYLFDYERARRLAHLVEPYDITWFEEPLYGNDVRLLRQLRQETRIAIAAGQNEGHRYRHRDLILHQAVNILQPNVLYVGGYTEAIKVAHMAHAFNLPIANGGAWPHHNLHLQAAVPNGTRVEFHILTWIIGNTIYTDPPTHESGWVTAPEKPGLGLEVREEVLRDTRIS